MQSFLRGRTALPGTIRTNRFDHTTGEGVRSESPKSMSDLNPGPSTSYVPSPLFPGGRAESRGVAVGGVGGGSEVESSSDDQNDPSLRTTLDSGASAANSDRDGGGGDLLVERTANAPPVLGRSVSGLASYGSAGSYSDGPGVVASPSGPEALGAVPAPATVGGVGTAANTVDGGPKPAIDGRDAIRLAKFNKLLANPTVDVDTLRELAWSGIPAELRPICWRLLLGYQPPSSARAHAMMARKRGEYRDSLPQWYEIENSERSDDELGTLRQIDVDVPRTAPSVPLFQTQHVQRALSRILYIWAIRHPASGYVQGINDLVTPFLWVFLSEACAGEPTAEALEKLPEESLTDVEADCFWCLSKLLDGIQDHYTFAQPGIQRNIFKLKEIVRKIDEKLYLHLESQNVEFLQFAFRWLNCLLAREIPFSQVQRLWDTYLSEGDKFPDFLVYVCAAFLIKWSDKLQKLDFQELVLFMQHMPTSDWTMRDVDELLSQAYLWRSMYSKPL